MNGIEFLLAKGLPPLAFKSSVVVLTCLKNVLGGMSFVILARLTGSQSVEEDKPVAVEVGLIDGGEDLEFPSSMFLALFVSDVFAKYKET